MRRLGMRAVKAHTFALAAHLAQELGSLQHPSSQGQVCVLYGPWRAALAVAPSEGARLVGPVVAFNVLRADGGFVGYREVERCGMGSVLWEVFG